MEVFLYNSMICRLCGEENDNGILLYSCEENNQTLSEVVNTYLPIKVTDDGELPRTICPGCSIQLEANVEFLNLIIKGQKILKELQLREREFKNNVFSATPKEQVVITENVVCELNPNDALYDVEHPIALQVDILEKPKRKRGRPPKKHKGQQLAKPPKMPKVLLPKVRERFPPKNVFEEPSGKRRRKTPTRYKEAVQGEELDRIFKEEGLAIDNEDIDIEAKQDIEPEPKPKPIVHEAKEPEVIGHMEDSGELVMFIKGQGRGRPRGRMKQTREECAICGMQFSCLVRYMSHIAQHGPVLYQCEQCKLTFTTKLTFTEHQNDTGHQGRNVIPCKQTDEKPEEIKTEAPQVAPSESNPTPVLASVENLVTDVPKSLPILDPQPVDQLTKNKEQNAHVLLPVNPIKTEEVISEQNPGKGDLQPVKVQPMPKPRLKCNLCDKTFSNKQSKSLHIKATHQGQRPYTCSECGARFAYPRSLSLHMVTHRRRPQGKGYACDLCGKVLNHPSSIVYHKAAEHAGQRYVCIKCGKLFKHKQLLQRHQLVHSQLRPYDCTICNATFKTKPNLLNHQYLHTGVKRFACQLCKHKFTYKTSLNSHMRWHTGQKPFACGICGKSFSQRGNLTEHERIHTGEKPFHCALCPRTFTTSSQLKLHAKRHQAELAYACGHCPKRFASRASWLAHQRRELAKLNAGHEPAASRLSRRISRDRPPRRHAGQTHKAKQANKQVSLLVDQSQSPIQVRVREEEVGSGTESDSQERVIYVTYDADQDFHILEPEQAKFAVRDHLYKVTHTTNGTRRVWFANTEPEGQAIHMQVESMESSAVVSECSLYPSLLLQQQSLQQSPQHSLQDSPQPDSLPDIDTGQMPVTDALGNPLHLTMADGTRLAITSRDGHSLQVVTMDGDSIPIEINPYGDDVVENEETIVHQLDLQKTVQSDSRSSPVTYFTIV